MLMSIQIKIKAGFFGRKMTKFFKNLEKYTKDLDQPEQNFKGK